MIAYCGECSDFYVCCHNGPCTNTCPVCGGHVVEATIEQIAQCPSEKVEFLVSWDTLFDAESEDGLSDYAYDIVNKIG